MVSAEIARQVTSLTVACGLVMGVGTVTGAPFLSAFTLGALAFTLGIFETGQMATHAFAGVTGAAYACEYAWEGYEVGPCTLDLATLATFVTVLIAVSTYVLSERASKLAGFGSLVAMVWVCISAIFCCAYMIVGSNPVIEDAILIYPFVTIPVFSFSIMGDMHMIDHTLKEALTPAKNAEFAWKFWLNIPLIFCGYLNIFTQ